MTGQIARHDTTFDEPGGLGELVQEMPDRMVLLWVKGILEFFQASWATSRTGQWL